jgi:hypothetical protein
VTGGGSLRDRARSSVPGLIVAGLVLTGCAGGEPAPTAISVRDSAGVRIVELASFDDTELPAWTIGVDPEVDIGVLDGAEADQLFQVSTALRLADGRIVVGNGGTKELRFYSATGTHLKSVGREGEGPGEFGAVGTIGVAGDSLYVFDWRLVRASVFDLDGVFARSYPVRVPGIAFPNPVGVLGDGGWIVMSGFAFSPQDIAAVVRDTSLVVHLRSDGSGADTLGRFPTVEFFMWGDGSTTTAASRAFGRSLAYAVGERTTYLGDTERYEIAAYAPDGRLESVLRQSVPRRPVTTGDIEAYKEVDRSRLVDAQYRQQMERLLAAMPYPDAMPAFGGLQVDGSGNLWVSEFPVPAADSVRWTVYGQDGRPIAHVVLPADLEVTQVGSDFVCGRWDDDVGVEHVRVYRLSRGERPE